MPERYGRAQLRLHLAATVALLAAAMRRDALIYVAAVLLAASASVLGASLLRAWRFALHLACQNAMSRRPPSATKAGVMQSSSSPAGVRTMKYAARLRCAANA